MRPPGPWPSDGASRDLHLHPAAGTVLTARRGPDALGHLHAHRHDRLQHRHRHGDDQRRHRPRPRSPGPTPPTSPTARRFRPPSSMRHRRGPWPGQWSCRGNVHVHPGRGHGPERRHGQTLSVTLHAHAIRPITTPPPPRRRSTSTQATPTITWANPADITYGTALSATQLDATSSWTVAGSTERRGHVHVHPGRGHGPQCRHGPDALGHVHAHRHDRLQHRLRHGDDQRRQGDAHDHLGQSRRHHLRHGALGHAARCDSSWTVDGVEWKCRGNFRPTPRPRARFSSVGTGQTLSVTLHAHATRPITTTASATVDDQRRHRPRPPSPGPTPPTSPTARPCRPPSSMRHRRGRWAA